MGRKLPQASGALNHGVVSLAVFRPAPPPAPAPDAGMACLPLMIDAIGTAQFAPALAGLCREATGFGSVLISALFADHVPVALYDDLTDDASSTTVAPYFSWAYLLDPFYDRYAAGGGDFALRLTDCAPDDFRQSEYFRRFYAATGLTDEIGLVVRCAGGAAIFVSVGNRDADPAQAVDGGSAALERLLPVVAALVRRNWPALTPDALDGRGRLSAHLKRAVALFGSSRLSDREAQIVQMVLRGHSNKSIANTLAISAETVKVHRKRIYSKLGVMSQGGLFSVFYEALSQTPPGADADPLHWLPPGFRPAI